MHMRVIIYCLVFLSGISGLIYQVVWHRYLAILLGAQARATAVVLAIFLGGISAGYWAFGNFSKKQSHRCFFAFAVVELGLALWGSLFPHLFHLIFPLTSRLYAAFGLNNLAIDFLLSVALLGVPTFLMGGTLPLMTQALSESLKTASRTHSLLYGLNTLGACLGCLFAGYILIPLTNLPFASSMAGTINFIVALSAYFGFAKKFDKSVPPLSIEGKARGYSFSLKQWPLLTIGFLSGFYVITLETITIRLMGLSTGASHYNFTLIVAIFIFALGVGSLAVRRISYYHYGHLFWNQCLVTFSLCLLYWSGDYWSYGVHVIRVLLRDLLPSFYLYQFLLAVAFTLLIVLPIGLTGIVLPLCFHLLKDRKENLGLRVGQLYGFNTVGCMAGALIGGFVFYYYWDLDQIFRIVIAISLIATGIAAYPWIRFMHRTRFQVASGGAAIVFLIGFLFQLHSYHRERWVQPFRRTQPMESTFKGAQAFGEELSKSSQIIYWKDGVNTSVGIGESALEQNRPRSRTIFVNGKSDGNTWGDFFTTVMLAHLPGLLAPRIDRTCVIGFGTGMTAGLLGQYPRVQNVDLVEISNVSIETAHYFDEFNFNASKNPKIHFHEMDAFRFLNGTKNSLDLIVSEPSNPWVTGIENLYSLEFYKMAREKLGSEGTFVQWIHTYSFNNTLLEIILHTMGKAFPHISVFQLRGGDLALVGFPRPLLPQDLALASERAKEPSIRNMLSLAGIHRFETLLALEIMTPSLVKQLSQFQWVHTLESPVLSHTAAKAFFVGSSATPYQRRREPRLYHASLRESLLAKFLGPLNLPEIENAQDFQNAFCVNPISQNQMLCQESLALQRLLREDFEVPFQLNTTPSFREVAAVPSLNTVEKSKRFTRSQFAHIYNVLEAYRRYGSPIMRIPTAYFVQRIEQCLKTVPSHEELYGECLIQKAIILETMIPDSRELRSTVDSYVKWFDSVPKNSESYSRLLQAKESLLKLKSLM